MIYMAKNIQIDDKRYRYFITDKDRAKRIFKKGSEAILKQLAKDTQHKLNKLNEKWYNTGSPSEHYTRIAKTPFLEKMSATIKDLFLILLIFPYIFNYLIYVLYII